MNTSTYVLACTVSFLVLLRKVRGLCHPSLALGCSSLANTLLSIGFKISSPPEFKKVAALGHFFLEATEGCSIIRIK